MTRTYLSHNGRTKWCVYEKYSGWADGFPIKEGEERFLLVAKIKARLASR